MSKHENIKIINKGERFPYHDIWVKRFKYHIIDLYNTDNRAYPAPYRRTKM